MTRENEIKKMSDQEKKEALKRYIGKENYYFRIRQDIIVKNDSKTGFRNLDRRNAYDFKVYYNGVQSFSIESNNTLKVNSTLFFTKTTKSNYKESSLNEDENKKEKEEIKKIFNPVCTIGAQDKNNQGYYKIVIEKSSNDKVYQAAKNGGIVDNYINSCLIELRKYLHDETIKYPVFSSGKYIFTINDNKISFDDLINLQANIIEITKKYLNDYKKGLGLKQIQLHEEIKVNPFEYSASFFDNLDEIMEKRIDLYNGYKPDQTNVADDEESITDELIDDNVIEDENVNKSLSERTYQLSLMNKLLTDKDSIKNAKNSPFKDRDIYPFEMEFALYGENRLHKRRSTNKGRVDCLLIEKNKVIFNELKIDCDVIDGTNGIHKHLIDLLVGFENEEAMDEINEYVEYYNSIVKDIENGKWCIRKEKLTEKEFWIFCGYSSNGDDKKYEHTKLAVEEKLKLILDMSCNDAGVKLKETDLTKSTKIETINNHLQFNKYLGLKKSGPTAKDLIKLLDRLYNCKVKIFITDQNYTEFTKFLETENVYK